MPPGVPNKITSRITSGLLVILLLAIAASLVVIAFVAIDIIDEGLTHSMTIFESEPKEGWDYWRWKAIKEALPSWIIAGAIWSALMGATLYFTYRNGRNLLHGRPKSSSNE